MQSTVLIIFYFSIKQTDMCYIVKMSHHCKYQFYIFITYLPTSENPTQIYQSKQITPITTFSKIQFYFKTKTKIILMTSFSNQLHKLELDIQKNRNINRSSKKNTTSKIIQLIIQKKQKQKQKQQKNYNQENYLINYYQQQQQKQKLNHMRPFYTKKPQKKFHTILNVKYCNVHRQKGKKINKLKLISKSKSLKN
eukprot:TRINITY_DN20509_c0_g1_i1.p2 TRINITY_DN20509_c0_g1~~TRINITY_DN20509_c0_g1_i1.p2  ORF type:complete len:195 (+),score=-9.65 TRINITY_DN20509_c0_g1_i1:483-1067(+)